MTPKAFGEGAFDDGEAVGDAFAFGDAAAVGAVEADGVDFVEVGHGVVLVGDVADFGDGGDVAVHGVDRFEHDEFGEGRVQLGEAAVEVGRVVVVEDDDFRAAVAGALRSWRRGFWRPRGRRSLPFSRPGWRGRPSWTCSRS